MIDDESGQLKKSLSCTFIIDVIESPGSRYSFGSYPSCFAATFPAAAIVCKEKFCQVKIIH